MGSGSSKKSKQKPVETNVYTASKPDEISNEPLVDDSEALASSQQLNTQQDEQLQQQQDMNIRETENLPEESNNQGSKKDNTQGDSRRAGLPDWDDSNYDDDDDAWPDKDDEMFRPTLDETLPALRRAIQQLRNKPILDHASQDNVEALTSAFGTWPAESEQYEILLSRLVQYYFVELIKDIWKNLYYSEDLFTEKKKVSLKMGTDLLSCLEELLTLNEAAGNRALQIGLHRDITGYLLSDPLKSYRIMTDQSRNKLAFQFVTILYLIISKCPAAREEYRDCHVLSTLQGLRELQGRRHGHLSTRAFMVQSFLFTEEDDEKYNIRPDSFQRILSVLDHHLTGASHNYLNYKVEELLEVINRLVINEQSKKHIFESGGLRLYCRLLKHGYAPEIRLKAAQCIWQLSFIFGQQIRRVQSVLTDLRRLSSNSDDELAMTAEGALWIIEEKNKTMALNWLSRPPEARHSTTLSGNVIRVFISYAENDEDMAIRIQDYLRESNFHITMNARMPMDDMAQAIDAASVVILCMSQNLKDSPRARTEASYAYHRNKLLAPIRIKQGYEPDGWLHELLRDEICIDFAAARHFEESMDRLIRHIRNKCSPVFSDRRVQRYNNSLPYIPRDVTNDITNDVTPEYRRYPIHKANGSHDITSDISPDPTHSVTYDSTKGITNDYTSEFKRYTIRKTKGSRDASRDISRDTISDVTHDTSFIDRPSAPYQPPAPAPRLILPPVEHKRSLNPRPISVRDWSQRDVDNWIDRNDLQHLRSWFRGMDGEKLREYATLRKEAPDAFVTHLIKKDVPINEMLALSTALSRLNNNPRASLPAENHR